MISTIVFGWNFQQWLRVAEYWRNTQGALPAAVCDEALRVIDHWHEHRADQPAAASVLLDAEGNPLDRFDSDIRAWVSQVWSQLLSGSWSSVPRPEYEKRADELRRAECGTRLWH